MIHELPGITPDVIAFGEELVAAGYTVVMPVLFGTPGIADVVPLPDQLADPGLHQLGVHQAGHRQDRTDHRLVAQRLPQLHAEVGGPGVGAIGMCFTGGYALAMMVDELVAAPVVAQPSTPFAVGKKRGASS